MKSTKMPIFVLTIALQGCANLSTIDRTTSLPAPANEEAKAIHLDAKQRLAFAKSFGSVCSEPSPDAMSAIASSLTASAVDSKGNPIALGSSLAEAATSIGLRTQSITLMRDMLYRICEAYYGRAIDGPQVMQLLSRSQDRAIAALAIEQLTGTVVAKQAKLSTSSTASGASMLQSTQALLDAARETEAEKNKKLTEATNAFNATDAEVTKKQTEINTAKSNGQDTSGLDSQLADLTKKKDSAKHELSIATASAADAKQNRETIEKAKNNILSNISNTANGTAALSDSTTSISLDQKNTEAIASAVKEIVVATITKPYIDEGCFALISRNRPEKGRNQDEAIYQKEVYEFDRSVEYCRIKVLKTTDPSFDAIPNTSIKITQPTKQNP